MNNYEALEARIIGLEARVKELEGKKPKPPAKHAPKPESFKEFFKLYPSHRKGGSDSSAWAKAKRMKLTESDFYIMIEDLKSRPLVDPQWKNGFIPGICNYLGDKIWLTPLKPEEQYEKSGQNLSPSAQLATNTIRAAIDGSSGEHGGSNHVNVKD